MSIDNGYTLNQITFNKAFLFLVFEKKKALEIGIMLGVFELLDEDDLLSTVYFIKIKENESVDRFPTLNYGEIPRAALWDVVGTLIGKKFKNLISISSLTEWLDIYVGAGKYCLLADIEKSKAFSFEDGEFVVGRMTYPGSEKPKEIAKPNFEPPETVSFGAWIDNTIALRKSLRNEGIESFHNLNDVDKPYLVEMVDMFLNGWGD